MSDLATWTHVNATFKNLQNQVCFLLIGGKPEKTRENQLETRPNFGPAFGDSSIPTPAFQLQHSNSSIPTPAFQLLLFIVSLPAHGAPTLAA
jgi:hypothetical protein